MLPLKVVKPVPLVPPPPCNRAGLFSVMLPLRVWTFVPLLVSGAIAGNEAKRRRQARGIVRSVIDDDVAPHDRARRRAGEAERKGIVDQVRIVGGHSRA